MLMKKILEYKVLQALDIKSLEQAITPLLKDGWKRVKIKPFVIYSQFFAQGYQIQYFATLKRKVKP